MGTPALAAHILERLATAPGANSRVVAVVTRPDTPRGRGLGMESSEVGTIATKHKIPTLKPVKIRTPEFLNELKAFEPDLLVVAAYGRILPNSILDLPRIAPINVHASLLPRHRGRSEEHTSELQSRSDLVCRLLLEKKKKTKKSTNTITTTITAKRSNHI